MKKALILLLAMILVIGSFTACGGGGGNDAGDNGGAAPTEIKIGLNYELSGELATYGQAQVDAIKMAFDEINAAGGVNGLQIVPVLLDNKSDPAEATVIATRLMTEEGVVLVLGPATSGAYGATVPVAMGNKIPILSPSATTDNGITSDASGKINDYVFRTCFIDSFQGVTMATFAAKNLNAKSAVIIGDSSSDYAKGLAKNFSDTFAAAGGTITANEGYAENEKDFNAILTKIKNQTFDVIFIPAYYNEAGLIIKQARALGITAPVLGADGFDSPMLVELAGADALNDVYFSNHYSNLDQDPKVQEFIAKCKDKLGSEPNAFHALGYDAAYFVADAITRAGSADPEAIKDAIAATKDYPAITGTFTVGENHEVIKAAVVLGLEKGVQASSVKVEP